MTFTAVAALIGWMFAVIAWRHCLNQLRALRGQLDPAKVVHQLNRGALVLPTDRPGPPREYSVHAEQRGDPDGVTREFWVWS